MPLPETLTRIRKRRGLTQAELAQKLYVTRQAVSRWETGETTPGIDMVKLMAVVLDVPIAELLDMAAGETGSRERQAGESGGREGQAARNASTAKETASDLDDVIEACAPILARNQQMSLDEAVSFLGAVLPSISRWRSIQENERMYGAQARTRYGDQAVDASNARILAMSEQQWNDAKELGMAIIEALRIAMETGRPDSPEARALCAMHAQWLQMHWGEGMYSPDAHLLLAEGYLLDPRFVESYDSQAGEGATQFLVDALTYYFLND